MAFNAPRSCNITAGVQYFCQMAAVELASVIVKLNSSPPGVAYMRQWTKHHWFRQWLVAWTAPSHYRIQFWLIVNWTLGSKLQWNPNRNLYIFIQQNALEIVVRKLVAILSRLLQCINRALWTAFAVLWFVVIILWVPIGFVVTFTRTLRGYFMK